MSDPTTRPLNKLLIATGIFTLLQAAFQAIYASLALAQYYCVIDFLRTYPFLIYIKILFFNNPNRCGASINIGESIDGVADQAFVLVTSEPFTTRRTFLINCVSLGLSVVWVVGSILLIKGGTIKHHSNHSHWPWLLTALPVTILDLVAFICFANDVTHTRTLSAIMNYIGGTASGVGNAEISTAWAAWSMAILYTRFVVISLCNVALMISSIVDCMRFRPFVTSSEVERNQDTSLECSEKDSAEAAAAIPRPGISRSFRAMKDFLFSGTAAQPVSTQTSIIGGRNRQRGVFFSEEIELPTTSFESMIGERQRRLNASMVDTSGRRSSLRSHRRLASSYSLEPPPEAALEPEPGRSAAADLRPQMPWSYVPASHRMRDQLPPDEELPPVPLPDYTAFQSARKASVHRAASSLSSMTQKKDYTSYQSPHQPAPAGSRQPVMESNSAPELSSGEEVQAGDASESVYEFVRVPLKRGSNVHWPPYPFPECPELQLMPWRQPHPPRGPCLTINGRPLTCDQRVINKVKKVLIYSVAGIVGTYVLYLMGV